MDKSTRDEEPEMSQVIFRVPKVDVGDFIRWVESGDFATFGTSSGVNDGPQ